MSDLQHAEKMLLEKILKMDGGYCLGFSNPSFARLFQDVLGINIYEDRFSGFGNSKANRMRCFWAQATNKGVAKLLNYLFSNWEVYHYDETDEVLPTKAFEIVYRLDPGLRKPISSPTVVYDAVTLNELYAKFQELTVMANSQARGFAFEKFLKQLFECFNFENPFFNVIITNYSLKDEDFPDHQKKRCCLQWNDGQQVIFKNYNHTQQKKYNSEGYYNS